MIQTWDWLFLHLPRDKKKQNVVLENMEKQKFKQIQIKDFILKFDFNQKYIYCDCVENYEFKHKIVPGKVSFEFVKEFLVTKDWNLVDESNLELCMKYQDIDHRKET